MEDRAAVECDHWLEPDNGRALSDTWHPRHTTAIKAGQRRTSTLEKPLGSTIPIGGLTGAVGSSNGLRGPPGAWTVSDPVGLMLRPSGGKIMLEAHFSRGEGG